MSGTLTFQWHTFLGEGQGTWRISPCAKGQRCVVHFYRNVLHAVPCGKAKEVALMLKAVHAQEDKEAARRKSVEVISKLRTQRLEKAARIVKFGCDETLSYYDFPLAHWWHIRTNNPLERLNREIHRRTRGEVASRMVTSP